MSTEFLADFRRYRSSLHIALEALEGPAVEELAMDVLACWREGRQLFLCGNGGSAANALHLANDLFYGIGKGVRPGMRVHALPANVSVLTCLANDEGYENAFALQLENLARPGDLLLVLSGSGNSPNILAALRAARRLGVKSYAALAFSGGAAKGLADRPIHVAVNDMQIAEDIQLVLGHTIMQWLFARRHDQQ